MIETTLSHVTKGGMVFLTCRMDTDAEFVTSKNPRINIFKPFYLTGRLNFPVRTNTHITQSCQLLAIQRDVMDVLSQSCHVTVTVIVT